MKDVLGCDGFVADGNYVEHVPPATSCSCLILSARAKQQQQQQIAGSLGDHLP
jgi:hypothetical protein